MKKVVNLVFKVFVIGAVFAAAVSCSSIDEAAPLVSPGELESVLIVKREKFLRKGAKETLYILVDGKSLASLENGKSASFVIKDGKHKIKAVTNLSAGFSSNLLEFDAYSAEIIFTTGYNRAGEIKIVKTGERALSPSSSENRLAVEPGIEGAVYRASRTLIKDIPKTVRAAVVGVSTSDYALANTAVNELMYQLVAAKKFDVVDRKSLDIVLAEQKFGLSLLVSDESAISLGRLLGANVVITGEITGSGATSRLMIKALDVETARVISMPQREMFSR
jgi:TolB-like protein